jgi:hypothetical protein
MITINLLQEFSDVYFENYNYNNRRVTSYELHKSDGFTFIHIIFEDSVTSSWVDFVRSENYYEWLNSRRDSKLESIGI